MTTMAAVTAATSVMPASATAATPSPAAAPSAATRPAITISITFPNRDALGSIFPVEVRFAILFELCAPLDRHRGRGWRRGFCGSLATTAAHLCTLLLEHSLTRKSDAVSFYRQHFHEHLVAFFQFMAYILDAMLSHFADVQQTVRARKDFDKRSEVRQSRYRTQIRLADFGRGRQVADDLQRLRRRGLVVRRNIDFARVFHIDLHTGLLDDAADHLPAGPDQIADLVHWNLQRVEPWRKCRNGVAMLRQYFLHLSKDVHTPALCLGERLAHDLWRDARDLDVHLQSGNSLPCPGNLEVHVAIMIFR